MRNGKANLHRDLEEVISSKTNSTILLPIMQQEVEVQAICKIQDKEIQGDASKEVISNTYSNL
jgi:hypothetical protein